MWPLSNQRVKYVDANGKLITASLKDYTRQKVREQYYSLDDFFQKWNAKMPATKNKPLLSNQPSKVLYLLTLKPQ